MTDRDHDVVKQNLLIEGLMDAISLGDVHGAFSRQNAADGPPVPAVQKSTLAMIRELVREGWFVLGVPTRSGGFDPWSLPLDAAMANIEDTYLNNFDDWWSWTTMVWLQLTEQGEKLARELSYADDHDQSGETPH